MPKRFAEIAFTAGVQALQSAHGSRRSYARMAAGPAERIGADERAFIAARDSFYLASVNENGWPYIQHRGGPAGFLTVIDETTLAFADFAGNKQYISAGNISADGRVALFLMDYPGQTRLKIFAHAKLVEPADDPDLFARLSDPAYPARIERAVVFAVEGFDWNCPQHITPRYTAGEIEAAVAPLHQRIATLEALLAAKPETHPAG